VPQGGGLIGSRGQREASRALGGSRVAERDEDRKPVQPRAMEVAECRRQQGVVVLRSSRLQDGRRTPPL
jgi:hypothetical protein